MHKSLQMGLILPLVAGFLCGFVIVYITMQQINKTRKQICEISGDSRLTMVVFTASSICTSECITDACDEIVRFVYENKPKLIVVDFEAVKFFSSQLLGMLLNVRSRLRDYGGDVVLSSINPQLYRVFKITNLDKIFRFYPDKSSAIEAAEQK